MSNRKVRTRKLKIFAATGLTLLMSLGGASAAWEAFKQSGDALFAFEPQKYSDEVAEVTNNSCMSGGVYENIPDEVFNSIDDLNTHYDSSWSNNLVNSLLGTPVTVEAATLPQFKDEIPDWASQDISSMADAGILKGYNDGTFKASQTMTRMEFIKVAVCSVKSEAEIDAIVAEGKKPDADGISDWQFFMNEMKEDYQRVGLNKNPEDFWGTKYLFVAHELKMLSGINYGDGAVGSGDIGYNYDITREEACQIMYLACKNVKGENLPVTKGIQNIINAPEGISVDYDNAVKACVSNGLIAGVDSNYTIAPKKTLTRAEASVIAARISNTSRRVAKPTVPTDKQEWSATTSHSGEMETIKNKVTGETKTMSTIDWDHFFNDNYPSYNGTSDGEVSKDGWWTWASAFGMWVSVR